MKYYKINEELLNLIETIASDAFFCGDIQKLLLRCGQLAVYMKNFEREEVEK